MTIIILVAVNKMNFYKQFVVNWLKLTTPTNNSKSKQGHGQGYTPYIKQHVLIFNPYHHILTICVKMTSIISLLFTTSFES